MDDFLADESGIGIPSLPSLEDGPVHSTPIKGGNVPLPSTRNVRKTLVKRTGLFPEANTKPDTTQSDSIQSIRQSDVQPVYSSKGQRSLQGHGHNNGQDDKSVRSSGNYDGQDLSNIDNLRPRLKESRNNVDLFRPERSASPKMGQWSGKGKVNNSEHYNRHSKSDSTERKRFEHERSSVNDVRQSYEVSTKHSPDHELSLSQNFPKTAFSKRTLSNNDGPHLQQEKHHIQQTHSEDSNNNAYSSYANNSKQVLLRNSYPFSSENSAKDIAPTDKGYIQVETRSSRQSVEPGDNTGYQTRNSRHSIESGENTGYQTRSSMEPGDNTGYQTLRSQTVMRIVGDVPDNAVVTERKRFTISNPRLDRKHAALENKSSLSSSKQNTSLSELENATLQKQRAEIQLLMTELKDRDRELSDMMTSHQQQLLAWEQDRHRLTGLDKKCSQYQDELRNKTHQIRSARASLKAIETQEHDNKTELESFRVSINKLNTENKKYKEELDQLRIKNTYLQETVENQSSTLGRLQAREQELTTSIKLKEKDISSATGHMQELSSRLTQLDLRCKECQDREKEALKEKEDWKHRYETLKKEMHSNTVEVGERREECCKLTEENRGVRQQLVLIQREAGMREKCKDELIDSMRIKQERTDSQLKNIRELYERQLHEVSTLQMKLDTTKDIINKQQTSLDDQQFSSSYNSRGNSRTSDYSPERSTVGQRTNQNHFSRHKSSPTHSSKYREPDTDTLGSHHQSQSSGYQSQLSETQTASISGNQPSQNTNSFPSSDSSTGTQGSQQTNKFQGQSVHWIGHSNELPQNSQKHIVPNSATSKMPKSANFSDKSEQIYKNEVPNENNSLDINFHQTSQNNRRRSDEFSQRKTEHRTESHHVEHKHKKYSERVPDNQTLATNKAQFQQKSNLNSVNESPPRRDGFIIQQTRIELIPEHRSEQNKQPPSLNDSFNAIQNVVTDLTNTDNDHESKVRDKNPLDNELEEKYVFENKLRSFLDDIDDIEDSDSIWEDKNDKSAHVSGVEDSPANKLQKLLLESRIMIQSLEKSAESPRQTFEPDENIQTGGL